MIHRPTRNTLVALAVAASLMLAGCASTNSGSVSAGAGSASAQSAAAGSAAGSSGSSAGSASGAAATTGGVHTVAIKITDAGGCAVSPATVPAGPVTFKITNVDATAVNEVHLMAGERIRGERENLAPGFGASFSATLDGGAYQIYCPGAKAENQPFTVTGKAAAGSNNITGLLQQATSYYSEYVTTQTGFLVQAIADLKSAIDSGDLAKAQLAYAKARPFYERIEPVAESFGDLDPDIDARVGDVPAAKWIGMHPIEKALFVDKSVAKAKPFVAGLVANVAKLKSLTATLSAYTAARSGKGYKPDEVANGSASLLEEVQQTKIKGEEERYSHIDLVDFAANVEGSQQGFVALVPVLNKLDPSIAPPIDKAFKKLVALLDAHKDSKALGGYTRYNDVSKADIKKLSDALLAVQEPLSQVSAKVASAG